MKPFTQLSPRGQRQRLVALARRALESYDLPVQQVRFFRQETNALLRVTAQMGERFVYRIYSEEDSTLRENQAEMAWLCALQGQPGLNVVQPVARRDGAYITLAQVAGCEADGLRRGALFRWLPGRPLADSLTTGGYYQLGQAMAWLHEHAAGFNLPPELEPKRWDRVFYYVGESVVYNTPAYRHLFTAEQTAIMDEVVRRAGAFLAELYAGAPPRLIHGDLHSWNVHVAGGRLYLLDFEDIALGYPLQDVAVTLYYEQDRPDYDALAQAFEQGYSQVRPWPVTARRQLELLWAARRAMFVNYVAHTWPQPQEFIQRACVRLGQFLERENGESSR